MGGEEGVSIGSADHGRHLSAKQVVHDTGTLLEAVQPGQQRLQQRTSIIRSPKVLHAALKES